MLLKASCVKHVKFRERKFYYWAIQARLAYIFLLALIVWKELHLQNSCSM